MRFGIFLFFTFSFLNVLGQYDFKDETAFEDFLHTQIELSKNNSTQDYTKELSGERCVADLRILKWCLEEAQTTLYRYASKNDVDLAFNRAFDKAENGIHYLDFIREIGKIQHLIACGHSGWAHAPDYITFRNQNVRILPLRVRMEGNDCVIFQNNSLNAEIPEGGILQKVNEMNTDTVLAILKAHMGRDGTSNDRSNMSAAKYFNMAYSNFIDNPEEFELEIFDPKEETTQTYLIHPLTKPEVDSIQKLRYPNWKKRGLPLRLEINEEHDAALYTIEWFRKDYIKSKGQDFETFTDSVFQVLTETGTENLYIDLRGNTGGWTAYGKYLLTYFIDEPVPYMTNVVANKFENFAYKPIEIRDPEYDDTLRFELNENGLYEWMNYPSLMAIPASKNRFKGQVYILTDNFTRSCSGMFCSLLRENTNALFVGEETGATQCGAGGMVAGIQLPHSKIRIHFSTAKYSCAVKEPLNSRGIIPDIELHNAPKKKGDWPTIIQHVENHRN